MPTHSMPRPPPAPLGGIVLAGGSGRRFGGPKANVVVGGRTLVERAVATLEAHCERVVIVGRPLMPMPPHLTSRLVLDRPGPAAAVTGLVTGLEALEARDVLVLGCDLIVDPELVRALADLAPGTAAVARDDDGDQPLCARYPRLQALAACEDMLVDGDLRLRRLVGLLHASAVAAGPGSITNINTMQEAAAAEERLARRARPQSS